MGKNQWYNEIAKDLSNFNLPEKEINRIAADYEFMAEAGRMANKFGINYIAVGSTPITDDAEEQYVHGSIAGEPEVVAKAIAVAMYNDPRIADVIKDAILNYGCIVKSHEK